MHIRTLVKFILRTTLKKNYYNNILALKSEYGCFISVFIHNLIVYFAPNRILNKNNNLKGARIKFKKISNNLYLILKEGKKIYFEDPQRWFTFRYKYDFSNIPLDRAKSYKIEKYIKLYPNDTVIDIGANLGFFSQYCILKKTNIIAIEAEKNIFRALQANCSAYEKISFHNLAITNKNGKNFMGSPINSDMDSFSLIIDKNNIDISTIDEVKCKTLDTLVDEIGLKKIKLIKCDAEGAESEVLQGAIKTLQMTEYIAFDCGKERLGKDTLSECKKIISKQGFEILEAENVPRFLLFAKNKNLVLPLFD